jgi:hypothetical protein
VESFAPMSRANKSRPGPGGNGTTMVIGREGQDWASAGATMVNAANASNPPVIPAKAEIQLLRQMLTVRLSAMRAPI